jgi:hypothetical protein
VPTPQDTRENRVLDAIVLAEIYAYRGQYDVALKTLTTMKDKLARQPDSEPYFWVLRTEARLSPFLTPLHSDPRWQQLMSDLDAIES